MRRLAANTAMPGVASSDTRDLDSVRNNSAGMANAKANRPSTVCA